MNEELPGLPLAEWEATKDTLHLYVQMVGKVRIASTQPRNHWWNAPLYVSARGLSTGRMRRADVDFDIEFDFIDHALVTRTSRGEVERFSLHDGLSVAAFYSRLTATLERLGIDVRIKPRPYGVPMTTPFPEDHEHAAYDAAAVGRFWGVLRWASWMFEEFSARSYAKTSPVHVFWHSFDLAVTRFSDRRAPSRSGGSSVDAEAYSHEVISFGFWTGDRQLREPVFYSYTAPEPPGLAGHPLSPPEAHWIPWGEGHLAQYSLDACRSSRSPRQALLDFLQSAYEAGATAAGWDQAELARQPPDGYDRSASDRSSEGGTTRSA